VVGAGHVGAAVAIGFASLGHRVVAVDHNPGRVRVLESQLKRTHTGSVKAAIGPLSIVGELALTTDLSAIADAEFVFICVPTPGLIDGAVDLAAVDECVRQVEADAAEGTVVVLKSTVPVGTTDSIAQRLRTSGVEVVANPEFLTEGNALEGFLHPDRIVIGGEPLAARRVADLCRGVDTHVVVTEARSAELIKYASNGLLAIKVSYANEIAGLASAIGADIDTVVDGLASDRRIGGFHLQPGIGWGGPCLPKDAHALVQLARELQLPSLVEAAVESNHRHIADIASLISRSAPPPSTIAVWGISFKAGSATVQGSPALDIVQALAHAGHRVRVHNPIGPPGPHLGSDIEVADCPRAACDGADALAILVASAEYDAIDIASLDIKIAYDVRRRVPTDGAPAVPSVDSLVVRSASATRRSGR
jgi:UDPglucose 6-dehydrogenase